MYIFESTVSISQMCTYRIVARILSENPSERVSQRIISIQIDVISSI